MHLASRIEEEFPRFTDHHLEIARARGVGWQLVVNGDFIDFWNVVLDEREGESSEALAVRRLHAVLDAHPVACVRLDLVTRDEDTLLRACDAFRAITEPRDVALVIADHWKLAERAGLDGVHLSDGSRQVKKARADLGADAIVGAFCGSSRHDGMVAGEMGADYVSFGPVGGPDLAAFEAEVVPEELQEQTTALLEEIQKTDFLLIF